MRRACKVTLKFITAKKQRAIAALMESYRAAVNFYVKSLWETRGSLNAETLARLESTRLSARYKSQALKQALEMIVATKRSAKALGVAASCPIFNGSAVLDTKFVNIDLNTSDRCGGFDLVIRLACLCSGTRLVIPTKRTAVLNKWLGQPGATLIQGCCLSEDGIVLWVNVPEHTERIVGTAIGVDVGMCKVLVDSNGGEYGTGFRTLRDKILRRKRGSKSMLRALTERTHYLNRTVKELPWAELSVIGVEDLHDMKRGKSKKRSKQFRKAVAPWLYRHVLNRIEAKAQENGVRLVRVNPANTSRTCPVCGRCDADNRRGENFLCVGCGYSADADHVGAQNILARTRATFGSVESPEPLVNVVGT